MNDKLPQSTKECDMYINTDTKLYTVIWKPEMMSDARFRELLNLFSEVVKKYQPQGIYVDARQHKHTILNATQTWHDEVIIPRYATYGVKRMAFITPESIFSELSHKKIFEQDKAKAKIDTRFFNSEAEAIRFALGETV